nr:hypothetical protein Iba_chr13dCG5250 [Ipomoea batatas]
MPNCIQNEHRLGNELLTIPVDRLLGILHYSKTRGLSPYVMSLAIEKKGVISRLLSFVTTREYRFHINASSSEVDHSGEDALNRLPKEIPQAGWHVQIPKSIPFGERALQEGAIEETYKGIGWNMIKGEQPSYLKGHERDDLRPRNKEIQHPTFIFTPENMTGDLGSAQRAGRVVLNPRIDAVDVETMAALRQLPAPLAAGDVVQTHSAVRLFFPSLSSSALKMNAVGSSSSRRRSSRWSHKKTREAAVPAEVAINSSLTSIALD